MVTEVKKADTLDLNCYNLDYAELLGVEWRPEINEIELKLRCPVKAWHLKEKRNKFFRYFGLGALITFACLEYELDILFLGVTDVTETLISEGHAIVGLPAANKTWMKNIIFAVDDIRVIKQKENVFRFYLRSEGLQLDFNFVDHIFRQLCIRE